MNNDQYPTNPNAHVQLMTAVKRFMTIAGQTTVGFNARQASLYLGLQFEELSEKIKELASAAVEEHERVHLGNIGVMLESWGDMFKQGDFQGCLMRADRAALLDADYDIAFVSCGAMFSTSTDAFGAAHEGSRSNLDKFPGGVAIRDDNGKVVKPKDWQPPNFAKFVKTDDQQPDS